MCTIPYASSTAITPTDTSMNPPRKSILRPNMLPKTLPIFVPIMHRTNVVRPTVNAVRKTSVRERTETPTANASRDTTNARKSIVRHDMLDVIGLSSDSVTASYIILHPRYPRTTRTTQ